MLKITFIGAGSLIFGKNVLTDIMTFPALRKDTLLCLEDIDPKRLDLMYQYLVKYKESNKDDLKGITIEKTTDQKKAVENAKYIISAVNIGGLEAYKCDVEIPHKYGVSQCVGDSLGPGGVFRFLRTVPFYDSLFKDIQDVGYNIGKDGIKPTFLNYTNPMAMNTWYCNTRSTDSTVGLCHGVQATAALLSYCVNGKGKVGMKTRNISYLCAGINHMAWFLEVWYKDPSNPEGPWIDAYPKMKEFIKNNPERATDEKLRIDMMETTGYFMTESSGHLSEYLPYYRKRSDLLELYRGSTGHSTLDHSSGYDLQVINQGRMERRFLRQIKRKNVPYKKVPSGEYASKIINAMETNIPFRFNANVINKNAGLITNLPKGCCVEVPIFADIHGIHPQGGITLPTICQALNMSNIMVQQAAVEGALTLDKEKIYHAILLDPNTTSVFSPGEIKEMVDELFEAEAKWIPKF